MGNEVDQSPGLGERLAEGGTGLALLYIGLKELLTNVAHFHFGPLVAGAIELLVANSSPPPQLCAHRIHFSTLKQLVLCNWAFVVNQSGTVMILR